MYIGLGSNLGRPADNLRQALALLEETAGYRGRGVSSFYRTAPVGPQDQPAFVNAVACSDYDGEPSDLLHRLLAIENQLGRVRTRRWGPRILDLDLLLFGQRAVDLPELKVPHPEMAKRAFVLVPLAELAPKLVLPGWGRTAGQLLEAMPAEELAAQMVEKL